MTACIVLSGIALGTSVVLVVARFFYRGDRSVSMEGMIFFPFVAGTIGTSLSLLLEYLLERKFFEIFTVGVALQLTAYAQALLMSRFGRRDVSFMLFLNLMLPYMLALFLMLNQYRYPSSARDQIISFSDLLKTFYSIMIICSTLVFLPKLPHKMMKALVLVNYFVVFYNQITFLVIDFIVLTRENSQNLSFKSFSQPAHIILLCGNIIVHIMRFGMLINGRVKVKRKC